MTKPVPALIAHRGYALRYPENTLESIGAALKLGACFLEFDVQLTADGVPVVFHDADLQRTAGCPGQVRYMSLAHLRTFAVGERARFGDRYAHARVPTLAEVAELLVDWPKTTAFVEAKSESMRAFGMETVIEAILSTLSPVRAQCVLISFDREALHYARARGAPAVGWVLTDCSESTSVLARELAPDYLFCNHTRLAPAPARLWPGPWQWALYDITEPNLALSLAERGAALIETFDIAGMLQHPVLRQRICLGR